MDRLGVEPFCQVGLVEVLAGLDDAGVSDPGRGLFDIGDWRSFLSARELRVETHFGLQGIHPHLIAGLDFLHTRHASPIHVGAVLAAKVADSNVVALYKDGTVVAADQVAAGPKLAVLRPADVERGPS